MLHKFRLICVFSFITLFAFAQTAVQTIRGKVVDAFSGTAIPGATVQVIGLEANGRVITKDDGSFELTNIPVGRWSIETNSLGYEKAVNANLMVNSGKEIQLDVLLEESATELTEVVVSGSNKNSALNEMALVSARSFTTEETERFAGTLGDPARMVANYAGVMQGNDSRNDIVIRGNSPSGVLWRMEGVEVSNPNHFGAQGTTGGAVSMLNTNLLANSDFLTGAFPAEYGNATSGIFDLQLRTGNNKKFEFTGQVGFNGFEGGIEGPITRRKGKENGSFIVDYRYSTMGLMKAMGMDFGTGSAIPEYQDFSAIIDLPTKSLGNFKFFTILGKSNINLNRGFEIPEEGVAHSEYGAATDFGSNMMIVALTNSYFVNRNTKIQSSISANSSTSNTIYDTIDYVNKSYFNTYKGELTEEKYSIKTELKHRISRKSNYTLGISGDMYNTSFADSMWVTDYNKRIALKNASNRRSNLLKAFGQYQQKLSDKLTANAGVYYQYYDLNKEHSVEPRLSLKWQLNNKQAINLGYGLHSQIQSRILYFNKYYNKYTDSYSPENHDLKSTKANHFVLGYDNSLTQNLRVKVETYYQSLYNVPVSMAEQQFSTLNLGADYYMESPDSLTNKGKGYNYGIELTLEKFLDKGYYFLFTGSVYDSKYQGYDKIWRNTAFNTNFAFNFLAGYEIKLSKKDYLSFNIKTSYAGGRRKTPIDMQESIAEERTIYDAEHAFEDKFQNYFRPDIRIAYRKNGKKMTQEMALDLQNITNTQNVFTESFNKYTGNISTTYQQGFMPMMMYRINF